MKAKKKLRIMIIVWKWLTLPKAVNDDFLKMPENHKYLEDPTLGKDLFYDEYEVVNVRDFSALEGGRKLTEEETTEDLIVRATIYNGTKTKQLLLKLIDLYLAKGAEIYLFLHRGDHFIKDDVKYFLTRQSAINKCFLFALGRDFIYLKTQKEGLIDDIGNFFQGYLPEDEDEKDFIQVASDDLKLVKADHFNRVWNYYEHEFKQKIFYLKIHLFDEIGTFMLPHKPDIIQKKELIKHLQQSERFVYTRIKSFLGEFEKLKTLDGKKDFEQIKALENELKAFEEYEEKEEKSYIFDDSSTNIKTNEAQNEDKIKISKAYDSLKKAMQTAFLENHGKSTVTKKELREVRNKLRKLIEVMPGETF